MSGQWSARTSTPKAGIVKALASRIGGRSECLPDCGGQAAPVRAVSIDVGIVNRYLQAHGRSPGRMADAETSAVSLTHPLAPATVIRLRPVLTHVNAGRILALAQFPWLLLRSVGEEDAAAEQIGVSASVHLSFEHLDAVDVAFDGA